jgi:serine/threonine protein phosphatase 1
MENPNGWAEESRYSRIIAIGDLHGYCDPLTRLLEIIAPGKDDLLIFIGDYVDRGPYSREVVQALIDFGSSFENAVFLKGNHEDMMLGSLGNPACVNDLSTWLYNGGGLTLKSYGMGPDDFNRLTGILRNKEIEKTLLDYIPDDHLDFISGLPLYFETERFFYCHAGVAPQSSIELGKQNPFDLLWMRDHIYAEERRWAKTVVCGHTPLSDVLFRDKLICVDTGLFCYGKLSAVDAISGEVYTVRR